MRHAGHAVFQHQLCSSHTIHAPPNVTSRAVPLPAALTSGSSVPSRLCSTPSLSHKCGHHQPGSTLTCGLHIR
eukprot:204734-Pelagomonas_calceolata.AAC.1